MKYTVEKKQSYVHVRFSCNATEWEAFMEKAYQQNKGKYAVQGFRKGHAPRKVLEKSYGKDLFFEDALYLCANEYFQQYLEKNKDIHLVGHPHIDDSIDYKEGKGLKLTLVFPVKPEVELGQYKGLQVKKEAVSVTDEEIENELKSVAQRNARMLEITDRAVCDGDEITLDYSGSVDGVKFDGGIAQNQKLVIGSHTFIPGFEEQLVGVNVGETKDISVKFPEQYHAENLKGKDAIFTCTVHAITKKELPEINDEFAKEVSEFSTLAEYKDGLKAELLAKKQKDADLKDENTLLQVIVENAKMDIPQEMVDEQVEDYIEDFKYQLSYQGLKFEDYLKYTSSTIEQVRESYKEKAQKAVSTRLVLEAIVKAEDLKATQEQVDAQIAEYAGQIGQNVEELTKNITPDQRAYFENQALTFALIDFLKAQNTFVD